MSASLKRVLRIRALLEERSRAELESRTDGLRQLERDCQEADGQARQSRAGSFASIDEAAGDGWQTEDDLRLAAEASWTLAIGRREELEGRRPALESGVDAAREAFLEERRGRREVEILLDAAAALERTELDRREQRQLDDWFQARNRGGRGPTGRGAGVEEDTF